MSEPSAFEKWWNSRGDLHQGFLQFEASKSLGHVMTPTEIWGAAQGNKKRAANESWNACAREAAKRIMEYGKNEKRELVAVGLGIALAELGSLLEEGE